MAEAFYTYLKPHSLSWLSSQLTQSLLHVHNKADFCHFVKPKGDYLLNMRWRIPSCG